MAPTVKKASKKSSVQQTTKKTPTSTQKRPSHSNSQEEIENGDEIYADEHEESEKKEDPDEIPTETIIESPTAKKKTTKNSSKKEKASPKKDDSATFSEPLPTEEVKESVKKKSISKKKTVQQPTEKKEEEVPVLTEPKDAEEAVTHPTHHHESFNVEELVKEEKELEKIASQLIEETIHPNEERQVEELKNTLAQEIENLSDEYGPEDIRMALKDIDFFAGNTSDECLERYCENLKTTLGYCRYHYIKNWKTIKKKRSILKEGKLQVLIEELIKKFPPKYIEAILSDLVGEKEFYQVLKELNIDTNFQEDEAGDIDGDDDITVETRGYGGQRVNYEDDELL